MSDTVDVLACFDGIYEAACESRDIERLSSYFASDSDISWWGSAGSEQFEGPDGFRAFADYITEVEGQISFDWSARKVRIENDTAWVNALGNAQVVTEDRTDSAPYRVTMIFMRRAGRWLLHTYHGSVPT